MPSPSCRPRPTRNRNNDVEHPYRQDSDFHYLTGFRRARSGGSAGAGPAAAEYILFVRDRDPLRETWDGRAPGPKARWSNTAPMMPFRSATSTRSCPALMENRERVYYAMGTHPEFDQTVLGWLQQLRNQARNGKHPPQEMIALDHVLHDMRLYKSRAELALMRESARIAAAAQLRAMRFMPPGPLRVRDRRRADA